MSIPAETEQVTPEDLAEAEKHAEQWAIDGTSDAFSTIISLTAQIIALKRGIKARQHALMILSEGIR